ncbi:uncharacterized protein LOC111386558 [Olea europaea var. sylvestris]|uniref:uncharacterized protein LOC111386558 n=1 Tax=Olea europaea var. sylvestris TaxID=158386 RepID=UPI000C1D5A70|nr:uncharacterized protein LOC111386558 [Olea europaea var. sylvestris]
MAAPPNMNINPMVDFESFISNIQLVSLSWITHVFTRLTDYVGYAGLIQLINSTVAQLVFTSSPYDSALFTRHIDSGITILLFYIDDMIITGNDNSCIHELNYFIGLEVSPTSNGYSMTQAKYASNLLTRVGLTHCKIADSLLEPNIKLRPTDGELLPDATRYRQLVGSLIYLTITRPNNSYAVHLVSQFMSALHSIHHVALLCILHCVKGTLFHGLHFSSHSSLTLKVYSNADWAGDPTDCQSTIDFLFLLGGSLISWRSKKHTVVARSSTEAEYGALAYTISELLWLR